HFWLGDAFASGGSLGYDHKAMGITAKGAWKSVERHFAEMDIDTRSVDFTVVGIGDMSGDVFGNGMLLSEHIRLLAAFDHRHIFLDPNPDTVRSFAERRRMFGLPRSSWLDYDPTLISTGGGVYERSAKAIPVSPEVRAALGIDDGAATLSPPEMIAAILTAPADLLWNGGIGTYVKASSESHADVGDKSNDAVRVDANRMRAKVIGEGGNLGVTALGRVEFSRHGGRINTDALDNSAGVDCSDHEVNLKILLDAMPSGEALEPAERDRLLAEMTDEVAELVLAKNISQNLRLGLSRAEAPVMLGMHRRQIADLAARYGVDRDLEGLPSDAELIRRAADGIGLTSPELANVMAHVKLSLETDLRTNGLPDRPEFESVLPEYFPSVLRTRFGAAIRRHPLRREIVTTMVVNDVIDNAGISYVFRLSEELGSSTGEAVLAFYAAVEIFDLRGLWRDIRTCPAPVTTRDAFEFEVGRTVDRAGRRLLLSRQWPADSAAEVARYRQGLRALAEQSPRWLPGYAADEIRNRAAKWVGHGAPKELAERVFRLIYLFPLLDVLDTAQRCERDPEPVATLYCAVMQHFKIDRLLSALDRLEHGDRWRGLARLAVRDDLYDAVRLLTHDVLTVADPSDSPAAAIGNWELNNRTRVVRAAGALGDIFASGNYGLEALSVAARQLRKVANGGDSRTGTTLLSE
ncbi:NAD-glutamate dehydrogenase, partial [Nocardia colli]